MIFTRIDTKKYGLSSKIDFRILREDLYPYYGGGNKARKLKRIVDEIKKNNYNAVVTTGSIYSNHCRATALMCSENDLDLTLVLTGNKEKFNEGKGNAQIIRAINCKTVFCKSDQIPEVMEAEIKLYTSNGMKPYYLYGGGHNKKGVEAYIDFIAELDHYLSEMRWEPDYIFLSSGTGSTQAGLVLGTIKYKKKWKIIGISIARSKAKGMDSILETFKWFDLAGEAHRDLILFEDDFLAGGYAAYDKNIINLSSQILKSNSLYLDPVYTGKGLYGTFQYLNSNHFHGNILFINTSGIFNSIDPLF